MPPLRRTLTLANFNDENQCNQPEKTNPLSFSLPPADTQDIVVDRRPLAILVQPCTSTRVCPSIFKPPATTTSLPRKSSPLGPHPYSVPGRPVFPRSARKPDLYRQSLKKSARLVCQAKRQIRRMEKKELGYVDATYGHTSLQNC